MVDVWFELTLLFQPSFMSLLVFYSIVLRWCIGMPLSIVIA